MAKEDKNTAIYIAYEDYEPRDPTVPEKNLLRAILVTAMADLKKPGEPGRRATEYFLSEEEDYIFSFVSVCNFLNVDPERIRMVTGVRNPRPSPQKAQPPEQPEEPQAGSEELGDKQQ